MVVNDDAPICELCGDKTSIVKKVFDKECNRCGGALRGKVFRCERCAKRAELCEAGSQGADETFEVCMDDERCSRRSQKEEAKEERRKRKTKIEEKECEDAHKTKNTPLPPPLEDLEDCPIE